MLPPRAAVSSVNKKWPFCFSPVPHYWDVKRWRRAANSSERRVNRLKTKREAESIVLEWGLEGLEAMMGQRPPHRDTGLLSARAFQEHTLPEKSLSQPPLLLSFTALYPNQLLSPFPQRAGRPDPSLCRPEPISGPQRLSAFQKEVISLRFCQVWEPSANWDAIQLRLCIWDTYTLRENISIRYFIKTLHLMGWEMCCHFKTLPRWLYSDVNWQFSSKIESTAQWKSPQRLSFGSPVSATKIL